MIHLVRKKIILVKKVIKAVKTAVVQPAPAPKVDAPKT